MNLDVNFVSNHRMQIGDYETAARCFQEVIDRHPNHPFAHYYLAMAYKLMKKRPDIIAESSKRFNDLVCDDEDWLNHVNSFELHFPMREMAINA